MRYEISALVLLAATLPFTSCGHPLPAEELEDTYLEQSCSLYCEQAIMCIDVSSQNLDQWEASTKIDCETHCAATAEGGAEVNGRPECVERWADLWSCAGMLETCEDFERYEQSAFGMIGHFEMWCGDELSEVIGVCS